MLAPWVSSKDIGVNEVFKGIRRLQFANDTLLFCVGDQGSIVAVKAILLAFEGAFGLKINFHKDTIVFLNIDQHEADAFADLMNCTRSSLSIIYLGLPLYDKKLKKQCWMPLIERVASGLVLGRVKFLLWDGRLILVNSVLSTLPSYYQSIFKLPKWILKRIDQL